MAHRLRSYAFAALLSASFGCIGSNGESISLEKQLEGYPDKGRTAVDLLTPGVLTITFDDGPSEYSHDIIASMAKLNVPATFFWVGQRIPGHREELDFARRKGQQIASHSYNHEPQPSLAEDVFRARVRAVKENIGDADGGRLFFRFPFGAAGDAQLKWLATESFDGASYRPVGWHLDSEDFDFGTTYPQPGEFSKNILDDDNVEDGGVCAGQKNPFQGDMLGWSQFIARKVGGGIMLFHDTQRITRDKIESIIQGFRNPAAYLATLSATKRAEYTKYYDCQGVDIRQTFTFASLHDGLYPSFADKPKK